ncbi:MAG: hypothetical protein WA708_11660 [Acidobacteriaceae bacterium]
MTFRNLAVFVSIVCAGSPLCLPAQTQGKPPTSGQASSYVPTYTFQLDKDHPTEYPVPSPVYDEPTQCTENGTVFINFYFDTPSHFSEETLFALDPHEKKTTYLLEDIHDLYDHSWIPFSVDATDAGVSFLIYATRDSTTKFSAEGKRARYTGEHSWYIARFDRDGSYKDSVPVDIPHFLPERIAQFDSGEYLVLGTDKLEANPKLAVLDSDGTLRSFLNPPKPLPVKSPFEEARLSRSLSKERRDSIQLQQGLQEYQLSHHGSAIDLLEPGTQGPVFEVFPDGSVNAIPIRPQLGYELDSIFSSSGKNLFVRFRIPGDGFWGQGKGLIEEIDVTDGTPLKRISFPEFSLWDILCIRDGKATILRTRKPSNASSTATRIFDIYQADLVPAPAIATQ